jgi:tRNA-dihydrouridine synthase A
MVGREAYHNPWMMASWDKTFFNTSVRSELVEGSAREITRDSIEAQMVTYMERERALHGTHWAPIARHMLGLRHGLAGSRRWRQVWSDHKLRDVAPAEVMRLAHQALENVETLETAHA